MPWLSVSADGQGLCSKKKAVILKAWNKKDLMENKGLVMSRNQILCHVWGYDFDGETRTVDVHVRTLRQKLGEAGNLIETVRGVGYRIGDHV